MNYLGISKCSIADGTGIRVVLWVSGCSLHCKGCHNPDTWDFSAGKQFDDNAKQELFNALNKPWVQGITLSGGHPLEIRNMLDMYNLLVEVKDRFPEKDIWLYTGLTLSYEQFTLPDNVSFIPKIAKLCDVIVDGPYIEEQRDVSLPFCGSSNQRIIDVQKTLQQHKIITIDE